MARGADLGTKRLISLAPDAWLRWITGRENISAGPILTGEFQWISRATDALIRAYSPETGEFLALTEVNLRVQPRIGKRVRAYAALAEEKYDVPVYPVSVNILEPPEGTVIPDYYESECLGKKGRQEYRVLNLWEVNVDLVFNGPLPALLPFVPVLKGGADESVVRQALTQLRQEETLSELEPLLALFAAYVLNSDVIKQMMRWDMTVLRENPIAEELIQIGVQEGRQEGRQEGWQEGRQEGLQAALLDTLEYRFGSIPEDLRRAIMAIHDQETVRALHRQAIGSESLDQFRASAGL